MTLRNLFTVLRLAAAPLALGLLLAGCGGGGGSPDSGPTVRPQSTLPASRPGDLVAFMQGKLRARPSTGGGSTTIDVVAGTSPPILATAAVGEGVERSGTTVQEKGVDEDDLIKTDGSVIYTLASAGATGLAEGTSRLRTHRRRADGSLEALARFDLPPTDDGAALARGMYLAAGAARVALLGDVQVPWVIEPCPQGLACITIDLLPGPRAWSKPTVLLDLVDVADPARPVHAERLRIDGQLIGSRMVGNSLVLVTQHAPRLAFDLLPASATIAEREAAIAGLKAVDLLPTITVGKTAPQPLLAETDCYLQPTNTSPEVQLISITVIDLASPALTRSSRCFAGGAEALYMSSSNLYLATTRSDWSGGALMIRYSPLFTTDIHKFRLESGGVSYRGSGEVSGHLGWDAARKSYRMSEHEGDLRVLSFTGELGWVGPPVLGVPSGAQSAPASPATLTILRERASDASLQVVAQLPNARRPQALGHPGEQVYGVRFAGARGYLVTFRQTDPLYVLDLADPVDPKMAGELKMPGFSDFLYPLDGGLLLGVGKDADDNGRLGGVKVALFDVADPAQPTLLASQVIGERGSSTALDFSPHGLNFLQLGSRVQIALPMIVVQGTLGAYQHGLQRFEVDTSVRTLRSRPTMAAPASPAYPDLSSERSVQIGAQVYYLSRGELSGADW